MEASNKSKIEEENEKRINSPYNTTYWNGRGKVFRAWPLNANSVLLTDIESGLQTTVSNLEINLDVKNGNLIEIDFTTSIFLPSGGTRPIRTTTPEKESSPVGKYRPSSAPITSKYRKANVSLTREDSGAPAAYAGSALPAQASLVPHGELPDNSPNSPALAPASPLAGKYKRKEV